MSDLMLDHLRNLVNKVSAEVTNLGETNSGQFNTLLSAIDDIAADILALEAVVSTILAKYPVEMAAVKERLNQNTKGQQTPMTEKMIEFLFEGRK